MGNSREYISKDLQIHFFILKSKQMKASDNSKYNAILQL